MGNSPQKCILAYQFTKNKIKITKEFKNEAIQSMYETNLLIVNTHKSISFEFIDFFVQITLYTQIHIGDNEEQKCAFITP